MAEDPMVGNEADGDPNKRPGESLTPKRLTDADLQSKVDERAKLHKQMVDLNAELKSADTYDAEKAAQWDALDVKFDAIEAELKAHNDFVKKDQERQAKLERSLEDVSRMPERIVNGLKTATTATTALDEVQNPAERNRLANAAISGWFKNRAGKHTAVTEFEEQAMDKAGFHGASKEIPVHLLGNAQFKRAQDMFQDAVGGNMSEVQNVGAKRQKARKAIYDVLSTTTPASQTNVLFGTTFIADLEEALLAWGDLRSAIDIRRTTHGEPIYQGSIDDTANNGRMLTEAVASPAAAGATVNLADPSFGQFTLFAWKGTSDEIMVSYELLEDETVGLQAALPDLLGQRIARLCNRIWTNGTGVANTQADGIVPQATVGVTAAGANAIVLNELLDLIHSVEYGVRQSKTCSMMLNDQTKKALRKIVDGDGRPLWQVDVRSAAPSTIYEYGYVINQDMDTLGTGNRSVLFGDLKAYKGREVNDIRVYHLVERHRETDQDAFLAFNRFDGRLFDPGHNPIKCLVHP